MKKRANGFDGEWNPTCPFCRGYMHTGHTDDCPVTKRQNAEHERLADLLKEIRP